MALLAVLGGVIGSQLTDVAATKDEGGRQFFGLFSLYGAYVAALLTAAAVALVLWQKLHRRAIFLWLIVVLAAEAAGLWLSTYSGARYTLAWYAVRVEGVIASSLLLLLLAQHFRLVQRRLASTVSSLQTRTEELQAAIHRRASAETQLAQSEKLRLVGQLGAGLAHDLNNILQVITGRLSILRRRVGDAGDADIQVVRQNVKKAEALTRQLSLLSTRRTMTVRAFAPGDDLARIAETTQLLLGKQHKLIFEAENQLPTITVDPLELEIAVTNLVTNARDALANGGVIEILARARAMPDGQPGLAVTVKDGGIGMAKELQDRIFEPFFTTKPQGKGTGLGLSQIAAFVESAGGTVEVVSTVGEGSAVTLLLPGVVAGRDAAPGSVDACSGLNFAGRTVLLVDDNDDVREASSQLLETFGFVVKAARSGEEALEALSTGFAPEFVVSDIVMDGMHGVELLRIIRKSHPAIRSVLVSGHSDIAQAAAEEGFVVIAKPYDVTVLLEALVIR